MAILAKGQLGLIDLNDVQAFPTKPTGATNGSLWLNTTDNQIYVYNSGNWQVSTLGLVLGGRNLLKTSGQIAFNPNNTGTGTSTLTSDATGTYYHAVPTTGQSISLYSYLGSYLSQNLQSGSTYSFSLDVRASAAATVSMYIKNGNNSATLSTTTTLALTANTWARIACKGFVADSNTITNILTDIFLNVASVNLDYKNLQLETGNTNTDWNPAPEDAQNQINSINTSLNDLADDSKLSRFERSLVRQQVNDLTGLWLASTDSMPTLATIDAGGIGSLYALRKAARDIGADTTPGTNYTNVGTNYTTLANYLNSLSPKPWDTALADTSSTPVTPATWNADWKAYNDSFNLLQIDVQDRQKAYSDTAAGNAQSGAIAAVQNAAAHQTTAIANPSFTINAPIATIGLPEYQGYHTDNWQINRNYIMGANTTYSWNGVLATTNFINLTLDGDALADLSGKTISLSLSYETTNLVRGTTNPWMGMELTVTYNDGTIGYLDCMGGNPPTGTSNGYVTAVNHYTLKTTTTIKTLSLMWGARDVTGTINLQQPMIQIGSISDPSMVMFMVSPKDMWAQMGNRIRPITNPTFSTGTSLTMNVNLYGDGTNNDSVAWDQNGNIVVTSKWQDVNLDDNQSWAFSSDATGYKVVKVPSFAIDVTNGTVKGVKYDGTFLSPVTSITAGDQVELTSTDNVLYVSLKDTDSGWGESYTPTSAEIISFFLGWKMCNGTYNTNYTAKREVDTLTIGNAATVAGNITVTLAGTNYPVAVAIGDSTTTVASKIAATTFTGYTVTHSTNVVTFTATQDILTAPTFSDTDGTGVTGTFATTTTGDVKKWYPIGDTDISRVTNPLNGAPTDGSPTLGELTINKYQVVYQVGTPTQVTGYTYNGLLSLIQGNNTVTVSYPVSTPQIQTGDVKYATNLATSTQDLTYVIPISMKRVTDVEAKTTADAIVNTVTQSTSYQTALSGKANSSALSNYAQQGSLDTTNANVKGLTDTINGINTSLSSYVTTTTMNTNINGVKYGFYKAGGMNLIKNSVGYDYDRLNSVITFWNDYTSYQVKTIQTNDLSNLGFGSGFYYAADTQNKGIYQDVTVVQGQHYTLSWYLNKMTKGADSSYRFFIQIEEQQTDGTWAVPTNGQIADNSSTTTNGFESNYMNYIPSTGITTARIRFIGYGNVEAYISGIMFTIGDIPIQWTLATGEAYNSNVRMNINGITVSQIDANGNETGYTQITPDEFAGYHSPNNDGTFEKVFYLNGDETVTKKITATDEVTMGNIKILPINGAGSVGWAFIPNNG